ncbi:pyridoxine biosynthesis protein pyroA [Histoplasma capsulatum H143]|uniref:Pyridoxine biosynthesis protein pyroA n=1 Tax=Ajellomyces capsulatus (strain H143) TaxID=544712 RepID=C6HSY5_AJECH|nr:pyridoxine biosynthesis protein pyroA [Histoplasma capsulatum H143]
MAPEISTGSDAVASASSSSPVDFKVKTGLAQMLKGGVIMDVVNAEQARIAEEAGACAVMALERVPADIRAEGGVSRMSDPSMIKEIMEAVTIPVMAKARIGHFVECQCVSLTKNEKNLRNPDPRSRRRRLHRRVRSPHPSRPPLPRHQAQLQSALRLWLRTWAKPSAASRALR